MQARGGAATAASLNDLPDLAGDDRQQQQDRGAINQEEGDDDFVGRCDRGQSGQHHEGQECREERQADGERSQ